MSTLFRPKIVEYRLPGAPTALPAGSVPNPGQKQSGGLQQRPIPGAWFLSSVVV
jgi:hypothetical protein